MIAVLALSIPEVEAVCEQASGEDGKVQVANDNCPGQVVVSGAGPALRRFLPLAQEAGAKKVVPLAVSIAAHSPLMEHAQAGFNETVEQLPFIDPNIPIIGNVSAQPLKRIRDIEDDLKAQLTSNVRWTESIEYMVAQGVDTFIEFGSGSVLIGLVKRINRKSTRINLGEPEDFEKLG
jgi:[acyl-carrier-protein] S-malonyltransferase